MKLNDNLEKKIPPIFHLNEKNIETILNSYLYIEQNNKDIYGEVFTPSYLIKDMLSQIPKHVWRDPNLKWLDPASGIGNFFLIVFLKLNEGLKSKIKNEKERKNHIINNMLYMVELNTKNVKTIKQIYGKNVNIYSGSFLQEQWKNDFNIKQFDIIIGNPPYNKEQKYNHKKGGGDTLWQSFIKQSLDYLKYNGYLVFVHPTSWRKPQSEYTKSKGLFHLMTNQNHMLYLEMHNKRDGMKTFNVQTRYDWYIIQKKRNILNSKLIKNTRENKNTRRYRINNKNTRKRTTNVLKEQQNRITIIKDEKGILHRMDLTKYNFLPNYNIKNILKLFYQEPLQKDNIIYSRTQFGTDREYVSKYKTKQFKYPLIHSTANTSQSIYYSNTKTPNIKHLIPMFGVKKVIYGETGGKPINDYKGEYGMTQGSFGIKIKNKLEGELIVKAIQHPYFKDILNAMSYGNFRIDWRIFLYIKPDWYKNINNY